MNRLKTRKFSAIEKTTTTRTSSHQAMRIASINNLLSEHASLLHDLYGNRALDATRLESLKALAGDLETYMQTRLSEVDDAYELNLLFAIREMYIKIQEAVLHHARMSNDAVMKRIQNAITSRRRQTRGGAEEEAEEGPPVVEARAIRVTHALPLDAVSLQLHGGKRLRVGVYAEFFPVAYKKGGQLRGFDVDLIEAFSRAAGLGPPTYVKIKHFYDAWRSAGQWADRIDVAIGGVGRSKYRESQTVEWSLPYFEVRRTVVYNLKAPILRFPDDVTGVVAGTMGSTGMDDAARRMHAKFRESAWDHLDPRWKSSDERDIHDLLEGKIQGLMRGSFVGRAIVARYPRRLGMAESWTALPSTVKPYGREVFAFPCRRGSGLAGALNAFLVRAAQRGDLEALAKKHRMI